MEADSYAISAGLSAFCRKWGLSSRQQILAEKCPLEPCRPSDENASTRRTLLSRSFSLTLSLSLSVSLSDVTDREISVFPLKFPLLLVLGEFSRSFGQKLVAFDLVRHLEDEATRVLELCRRNGEREGDKSKGESHM